MTNFQKRQLVVHASAAELPALFRAALARAVSALLANYGVSHQALSQVTSRTTPHLAFALLAHGVLARLPAERITAQYLQTLGVT